MKIAAWVLTLVSALACLWLVAAAERLIGQDGTGSVLHDIYYQTAQQTAVARGSLLVAFLALANGAGSLLLLDKRRPGALWVALLAGLLALIVALWHYTAVTSLVDMAASRRVPDYAEDYAAAERGAWLRAYVAWAALGFTVAGWAAWLVNRRIAIGHGRD
jgi:hypothetical protein